jgi:HAD superfamily hydrolase (TIGR01549 family)
MTKRAVMFDLDDTLVHIPERRGWDEMTRAQVQRLRGTTGADAAASLDLAGFIESFWGAFNLRLPEPRDALAPPFDEMRWLKGEQLMDRMLRERIGPAADHLAAPWWRALFQIPPVAFGRLCFPDTIETLTGLLERGFSLGVVTNRLTPADLVAQELEHLGLHSMFETIVSAGEAGFRKPHAAVFESALSALGVGANEAVMVGDSLTLDVEPANRLGIVGVLKRNGREPNMRIDPRFLQIDDLDELLGLELLGGRLR